MAQKGGKIKTGFTQASINAKAQEQKSKYQNCCKGFKNDEEWEIGIDEAGRGPVLGAMVYGAACWPISHRPNLAKIGFSDSKQLNEKTREWLFEALKELKEINLDWEFTSLSPQYLSEKMLNKGNDN